MQTPETMRIEKNSVPVVVSVSSQHGGVGLIRSLGRKGVRVYGVHQSSWEPAAWSRYLQGAFCWDFSSASKEDSLSFLVDVAKRVETPPILIATSDITALFVAENAADLAKEYLVATPYMLQIGDLLHAASHSPIDWPPFQDPPAPGVIIASVLLVIVNASPVVTVRAGWLAGVEAE